MSKLNQFRNLLSPLGVALILGIPGWALAHPPCCVQCVNPHGHTIPSDGSLPTCDQGEIPTTNASKAGENPDGFFFVGTTNGEDGAACGSGDSSVTLIDLGTGQTFGDFANGTVIKYTQAPGTETVTVKKIGSDKGKAGAVDAHLTGAGDLQVCSDETGTCVTCLVPPKPK